MSKFREVVGTLAAKLNHWSASKESRRWSAIKIRDGAIISLRGAGLQSQKNIVKFPLFQVGHFRVGNYAEGALAVYFAPPEGIGTCVAHGFLPEERPTADVIANKLNEWFAGPISPWARIATPQKWFTVFSMLMVGLVFMSGLALWGWMTPKGGATQNAQRHSLEQAVPPVAPPGFNAALARPTTPVEESAQAFNNPAVLNVEQIRALNTIDAGGAGAEIWVFTDPRCPACQYFEKTLSEGIKAGQLKVHYVPTPIRGEESAYLVTQVLCDNNPLDAWKKAITGETLSFNSKDKGEKDNETLIKNLKSQVSLCVEKTRTNFEFFKSRSLSGTPTIVTAQGRVSQAGAMSLPQLMNWVNQVNGARGN